MENSPSEPGTFGKLEGKVALITGGAGGIGASTARLFCQHGAKVVLADIQDELGNSICRDLGLAAAFIHCDVANEDDISRAVDFTVAKFRKLDIMFNNAGTNHPPRASILENDKKEFEQVLAVNLVGPFLGIKHAARVMIPARRGSIINTASVAAVTSSTVAHAYASSKCAVVGLTRNAAVELGRHGIRVNCVSPAGLPTAMTLWFCMVSAEQLEKMNSAVAQLKGVTFKTEDVAKAVLFLASDDSRYISGHNLVVDGAHSVASPQCTLFNK